jgi:hypothetical protein
VTTPPGFRHGLRVRLGSATGPQGKLLHCQSNATGAYYWRVRLLDGSWAWPDAHGGIVVDGPGTHVNPRCANCELPFVTHAGSGELLCAPCDREQFGTEHERLSEPPPARRWNSRRRWIGRRGTR